MMRGAPVRLASRSNGGNGGHGGGSPGGSVNTVAKMQDDVTALFGSGTAMHLTDGATALKTEVVTETMTQAGERAMAKLQTVSQSPWNPYPNANEKSRSADVGGNCVPVRRDRKSEYIVAPALSSSTL